MNLGIFKNLNKFNKLIKYKINNFNFFKLF